jgi:DNA-binding GntR family transcriptional regulator
VEAIESADVDAAGVLAAEHLEHSLRRVRGIDGYPTAGS